MHYSFLSILVVTVTVSLILVTCDNNQDQDGKKDVHLSKHSVLLIISFDGFRYDFFNRLQNSSLDQLKAEGVSVPYMRNQFVTKTFPNHVSIATGLHVETHGVVDNTLYDPLYNLSLKYDSNLFWNPDNNTLPIWTLNELGGDLRRSGIMMWPGGDHPYGGKLPKKVVSWNDSIPFEWRIDKVLEWILDKEEPLNLVMMYFEEPDEYAHAFGPESKQVTEKIEKLDNATSYLVQRLKEEEIYDKINIVMLSDHGFQEVLAQNMINISNIVNPELYDEYGSTPVLQLIPKPGKFDQVYQSLQKASEALNFSVYRKQDIAEVENWYYSNNRRILDIILVADLGYVFQDFAKSIEYYDSHFNRTPSPENRYGVHGYDNGNLRMHPFFLAHGPAFKKKYIGDPFDNIDLFPLMCKILGLHTPPNNGSLDSVKKLMISQGFAVGSPVGLAIGAGLVFGALILLGILSILASNNSRDEKERLFHNGENAGYRFINRRDSYDSMDDNENIGTHLEQLPQANGRLLDSESPVSDNNRYLVKDEYRGLLLSSSTEEV